MEAKQPINGYEIAFDKIRIAQRNHDKRLDLGQLGLTELPQEVFDLFWLEELVLGNSYYPTMEEQEAYLAYDKEVFKTIFPNGNYTDNVHFGLGENKFKYFDVSRFLNNIRGLKYLNLSSCILDSYFEYSNSHKNAEILILDNNAVRYKYILDKFSKCRVFSLRNMGNVLDKWEVSSMENLEFLNISSCNIPILKFDNLNSQLQYLICNNSQIGEFNINSKSQNKIIYIEASFNNLTFIPDSFFSMIQSVIFFNLSDNKIMHFRVWDIASNNLENLNLSNNLIREIGKTQNSSQIDSNGYLPHIKKLNLKNNLISKLPKNINAIQLQELDLSQNQIIDISPLFQLKKLKKINLSNNKIKDPSQIKKLLEIKSLIDIDIEGEQLESIPLEKRLKKTNNVQELKNYFEELETHGEAKKGALKIILVGNSSAGKTSLRQMLQDKGFDVQQISTHGIAVDKFKFPKDKKVKTEIELWDFGGQEYYHETHRMFFSYHAIYIVVWDAQTNKNMVDKTKLYFLDEKKNKIERETYIEHHEVDYWLKQVRYYTDEKVPILLVQNKIDRIDTNETPDYQYCINRISTTKLETIQTHNVKYEFHLSLKQADTKNTKNEFLEDYQTFESYLEKTINEKQKIVSVEQSLEDLRVKLEKNKKVVLSRAEFDKICSEIHTTYTPDIFLDLLRKHCEALHFPENEILKDYIFINTERLNDKIYEILDFRVLDLGGFFDKDRIQVSSVFADFDQNKVIELLKEMKLIFEDKRKNKFVAPQYLPTENTSRSYAFIKNSCGNPKFILKFPNYLPKTISNQILAKYAEKTIDSAYFKHGLAFEESGFINVIEVDYKNAEIWFYAAKADAQKNIQAVFDAQNIRKIFEELMGLFGVKFLNTESSKVDTQAIEPQPLSTNIQYIQVNKAPQILISIDGKNFVDWKELSEKYIIGSVADANLEEPTINTVIGEDKQNRRVFRLFYEKMDIILKETNLEKTMEPVKVFISYSHKDESFKDELIEHLSGLKRNGVIQEWNDRAIVSGDVWDEAIKKKMDESQIIIFLVSSSFMASNYINDVELKMSMQKNDEGKIIIAPVQIRKCDFKSLPLKKLQTMTKDNKAISSYNDRDEAWVEVIENLKRIVSQRI